MATEYSSASEYIGHHLSFMTRPHEGGGFWTFNVDSIVTSIVLGVIGLGFLRWIVANASTGVPGKVQAFVEVILEFIDEQVRGIFHHGDRNKFVAPAAVTVFVWVVLMNAMDHIPADLVSTALGWVGIHEWRLVPTADVNTTFALSLSVFAMMIWFSIAAKGVGGWIHELFCAPFGSHVLLWPANLLFNMVEYVSKPLSHSLRLFGNMYAGEILFLLLWLWAANSSLSLGGAAGWTASVLLAVGWEIFHVLIVLLQAYIFMMLTIVYVSMAHEHH
ncbi:MAG TPA: F0F1 ATP synthase subunit A [Burkholderiales bacterium]|jgi:F-type H+-transporting ATPase subunit a|nr:F0F1 ATP synthase subunit A [Burkholderiales bacterium]